MQLRRYQSALSLLVFLIFSLIINLQAQDWQSWRGPGQNGVSGEGQLVSSWSPEGENLIWRADFSGRSTPIVMNGRVYVIGRGGAGVSMHERVSCFDAGSGKKLWEHRYNMRNSYVPFSRTGWASMAGDAETGYAYSMGSGGMLHCFDKSGKIVWKRSMIEDFSVRTGYGGRTTNPVIDEDLVIVGYISAGWGDQKAMKHRYFAFDKRSGEVVWMATPGGIFKSPNIYSNPVVAVINGQRLIIGGNSDGSVYAMQARTGKKVWQFTLSKGGLNSSVVVDGYRVYAAHSEENIDTPKMGRIVCIDGRGEGDITDTHELWRFDAEIGYTSPLLHDGRIYYVNNAGNMYCLDAESGRQHWELSLGTVGKGSPVWADGKIYATEVNGRLWILSPGEDACTVLDEEEILMPDETRRAEIYGSVAVAYNRIYMATEEGVYCIGNPAVPYKAPTAKTVLIGGEAAPGKDTPAAWLQVIPAETVVAPGEKLKLAARLFDARGRLLGKADAAYQAPENLGSVDKRGVYKVIKTGQPTAGVISATHGEFSADIRVRVFPPLPWTEDFEGVEENDNPAYFLGAGTARSPGGKFIVKTLDGNKVLSKPPTARGIQRHFTFTGPSDMHNYVLQVDVRDTKVKRRRGNMGLISHGYTLDLNGKLQRLEIRSWTSENRIRELVDFPFDPDRWYTMKMDIDFKDGKALVKGKVWPQGDPEPAEWSITVEDPHPTTVGAPAIYGESYTEVYFDNFKVMKK